MPNVTLSPDLRSEYVRLFQTCAPRPARMAYVETLIELITESRTRYEAVSDALGGKIPWTFIGAIHSLEAGLRFDRHLHNGDPLTARTRHVPANRPAKGNPPFTWEASASDALTLHGLQNIEDWGIASTLYQMERYNGWGYRLYHPATRSPYLWGMSNHYASGKYVKDGVWSASAVSAQCGGALLLRRMAEKGDLIFPETAALDASEMGATVRYAPLVYSAAAQNLQRFLNQTPGVFLLVDGKAGTRTSDAFRKVTGHYLKGDPRADERKG